MKDCKAPASLVKRCLSLVFSGERHWFGFPAFSDSHINSKMDQPVQKKNLSFFIIYLIESSFACICLKWATCISQSRGFEFLKNTSVVMWRLSHPLDYNFLVFQALIYIMLNWDSTDPHTVIRESFFPNFHNSKRGEQHFLSPAFDFSFLERNNKWYRNDYTCSHPSLPRPMSLISK